MFFLFLFIFFTCILKGIDQTSRKFDACKGPLQGIYLSTLGNILMQIAKLLGSKNPFLFNASGTRKKGHCDFLWNVNEVFDLGTRSGRFNFVVTQELPLSTETGEGWARVSSRYHWCEGYFIRVTSLRNAGDFLLCVCLSPFCFPLEISSKAYLTPLVKEADLIPLFPSATLKPGSLDHSSQSNRKLGGHLEVQVHIFQCLFLHTYHTRSLASQQGPFWKSWLGDLDIELDRSEFKSQLCLLTCCVAVEHFVTLLKLRSPPLKVGIKWGGLFKAWAQDKAW